MTVIKFIDDKSIINVKPGVGSTSDRVFNAVLKYTTKNNLPSYAERNELIFTIDTHEFYRGDGVGTALLSFSYILMYESFNDFPDKGISSKIYLDKTSSLFFYWTEEGYKTVGGAGGSVVISPSDSKIGDLDDLLTNDKTNIVLAINEIFNSLTLIDIANVNNEINQLKINLATAESNIIDNFDYIQSRIGDISQLNSGSKTSLVDAINEILANGNGNTPEEVDFSSVVAIIGELAALKTVEKGSVVSAINEITDIIFNNSTDIQLLQTTINALAIQISNAENKITINESQIVSIENAITQINVSINNIVSIVGSLVDLETDDKTSIIVAINELVAKMKNFQSSEGGSSSDFTAIQAAITKLSEEVGELASLNTTSKSSLSEAINELLIAVTSNENRIVALENIKITEEDKKEYDDFFDQILNKITPDFQKRISALEVELLAMKELLKSQNSPAVNEGGGETPTEGYAIDWEHEFTLPTGVFKYDFPAGFVIEEDDLELPLTIKLFSLGSVNQPEASKEIPHVGDVLTEAPTIHGKWDTAYLADIVLESAAMTSWKFKLVRYKRS